MRIATATPIYKNHNYGAFLQAYALQRAICNIDYKSEVINYQHDYDKVPRVPLRIRLLAPLKNRELHKYLKRPFIAAKKIIRAYIYQVFLKKQLNKFNNGFKTFARKFIKTSEIIYSNQNYEEIGRTYDKIIVGSDQVWVYYYIKNKAYTLDFLNSKPIKLSYAASFGNDEIKAEIIPYVKKLTDFDRITVRESSGVDIIKKYTGKEAEVVLDPTFLLDKAQWTSLAAKSKYPLPEHYVFVYAINDHKREILDFSKKLAKRIDGKVILVHRGKLTKDWLLYSHAQAGINPTDWVKLLLHADYVVTDSFHGTAFAVNLEKQFYVYANSQVGRINTVLDMCGLQSRRIDGGHVDKRTIDFTKPRAKLAAERERCNGVLKEMLEWDANDGKKY